MAGSQASLASRPSIALVNARKTQVVLIQCTAMEPEEPRPKKDEASP